MSYLDPIELCQTQVAKHRRGARQACVGMGVFLFLILVAAVGATNTPWFPQGFSLSAFAVVQGGAFFIMDHTRRCSLKRMLMWEKELKECQFRTMCRPRGHLRLVK